MLKIPEESFRLISPAPAALFPSPSPPCSSTAQAILPTDGTWAGEQTNWLPPAGALRACKADERSLAKSPAGWKCPRNLPSAAFPRGSGAPAPSSPGCRCTAGSSRELPAGGGCGCVLSRVEEAVQAEYQWRVAFFHLSTTFWFGGLAACS